MGTRWISWRMTATVVVTLLQIPALISITTKTAVEGQTLEFRCRYQDGSQVNQKYFSQGHDSVSSRPLVSTDGHQGLVRRGRFSLYDNTTGAFFVVRMDNLVPEDTGTYRCGVNFSSHAHDLHVIQLNVSRVLSATETPSENPTHDITASSSTIHPNLFTMDKLHMPLYMTAVTCATAILCVCMFMLGLMLAVKHRRPGPRPNREASATYVTMMPAMRIDPDFRISCPDCAERSDFPPPPSDLCSSPESKQRDSIISQGLSEYVEVDAPRRTCPYQNLDISQVEEHVYHSLHGKSVQVVKEQL